MAVSLRRHLGPAVLMGGGLVVVGLAGYGFLALSGHTLSTDDAAAMTSFYLILSIVGSGVFAGLEQETSRSASAWLATGRSLGVIARRAATVGVGLLAVVLVVLGVSSPIMTGEVLSGQWGLFLAIVVGVIGTAAAYLVRGLLGSVRKFTGYAVSLAAEGFSRIVLCGFVVVIGVTDPTVYSLVFAAGATFAMLAGLPWLRRRSLPALQPFDGLAEPPAESVAALAKGLGLLVGAMLGFQAVANVAPILVTARLEADTATAAAFALAFVLVRIPVLLFAAVSAMLLPAVTRAVTNGDIPAVRVMVRKVMLVLAAIGLPTIVGATVLGPWAVEFFFGAKVRLPHWVLGLLAVSTVLLMITQVLMPAMIALNRHRTVMTSWALGVLTLIGMLVLPGDPVALAVWGQLLATGIVVAIMVVSLAKSLGGLAVGGETKVPVLTS